MRFRSVLRTRRGAGWRIRCAGVPGGLLAVGWLLGFTAVQASTPDQLYRQHCAACHGPERLGGQGPALVPENLGRLKPAAAADVIRNGRAATQMPGFAAVLEEREVERLAAYLYTPAPAALAWGQAEIEATRVVYAPGGDSSAGPVYDADPLNLFLVVEAGDHHITVLDGDRFRPIHRFPTRRALHGGPKYTSDGRFVFLASRDGWITKYDMHRLETVAEVRAGINTRNLAVSHDDRYVLVGNYLPHTLVLLDAKDLSVIKVIAVADDFANSSRVSAVYTAPPRASFIVALKDLKEVWEIFYADDPPLVANALMHDFRMGEGMAEPNRFPVRRIQLDDYLDDFFFDPDYTVLIGAAREAKQGQVISLIVGRRIADVDLPGLPHLGSGISWTYRGATVLATPNLKTNEVSVIDTATWKTVRRIETLGPGFFMRSHENSRYAWVDVFFGPHKDAVHVIDKDTLEIVKTLRPAPGKTAAHVEFTRDGRYALLSIWDVDGAVVVYDAQSLQEKVRIPMNKPVGKYNVYNKISGSAGTSH